MHLSFSVAPPKTRTQKSADSYRLLEGRESPGRVCDPSIRMEARAEPIDRSNQPETNNLLLSYRFRCSTREISPSGRLLGDQEAMTAITRRFVSCALVILFWAPFSASSQDVSEPEGYRTEDYRAPTLNALKGVRVVTTAEAEQIWKAGGAIFLDVLPYAPRPTNLPPGTIWREKPRRNIPGSSWLPDTGYGALAPVTENYL